MPHAARIDQLRRDADLFHGAARYGPGAEQRACQGAFRKALLRMPRAGQREKEGPRLRGVYGRMSGTVASFQYSSALKGAHITWDATSLDKWLADPEKLVPDSDMAFQLVRAEERTDIIAYLKELSSQ